MAEHSTTNAANFMRFHDAVLNNSVEVAKELLDDDLDPNGTLEVCTCPSCCCEGYTLLYMACVHDRMTIVKMLLGAGADPDICNIKADFDTPFLFVIKQRNPDLLRVLMRESKVLANLQCARYGLLDSRVPYGLFYEFHENDDVIKVLMGGESIGPGGYHLYNLGNLANLLRGAAKYRSSEVFKVLLNHCGVQKLVYSILKHDDGTEAMSNLIDVYGAREFLKGRYPKKSLMMCGSTGILELLMSHLYQLYGDNKEMWTEQIVTSWSRNYPAPKPHQHYMYFIANSTLVDRREKSRFDCLLRWGMYSVLPDLPQTKSVFFAFAESGMTERATPLINLYPQCLQEKWLRDGRKPWTGFRRRREKPKVDEYFATLVEESRHAPTLQILCRSVIFHNLGINPIPKAEHLPLPRKLKDFVQCKELFETDH